MTLADDDIDAINDVRSKLKDLYNACTFDPKTMPRDILENFAVVMREGVVECSDLFRKMTCVREASKAEWAFHADLAEERKESDRLRAELESAMSRLCFEGGRGCKVDDAVRSFSESAGPECMKGGPSP